MFLATHFFLMSCSSCARRSISNLYSLTCACGKEQSYTVLEHEKTRIHASSFMSTWSGAAPYLVHVELWCHRLHLPVLIFQSFLVDLDLFSHLGPWLPRQLILGEYTRRKASHDRKSSESSSPNDQSTHSLISSTILIKSESCLEFKVLLFLLLNKKLALWNFFCLLN